jgi:1-deoxy-D-xylulose-5-phosphate reductoisomerase
MQSITVLGATGSIGLSTLDVVARHPDKFRIFALSAHTQVDRLFEQCVQHRPDIAVVGEANQAKALQARLAVAGVETQVQYGPAALEQIASAPEVDVVMAAIVGAAGLGSAVAAARRGKTILLANKESLVMAGHVFLSACREGGATVLPIDSEHNAIFQCLPASFGDNAVARGVRRILLTASGGPFRLSSSDEIDRATPEQAIKHPRKGLELIEAHLLFGLPSEDIDIVVHPQSIVHSLVEYVDGSVLAQLGNPDMRTPIAHALGFPERIESGVSPLDLARIGSLDFEPPDPVRFPCLRLARSALTNKGGAACVLNAANEVAVGAFLDRRVRFGDIARINERVLDAMGAVGAGASVEEVVDLDRGARDRALREVAGICR